MALVNIHSELAKDVGLDSRLEGNLSPFCFPASCPALTGEGWAQYPHLLGYICHHSTSIPSLHVRLNRLGAQNLSYKSDQHGHRASDTASLFPSFSTASLPRTGIEYKSYSASISPSVESGAVLSPVCVRIAWLP